MIAMMKIKGLEKLANVVDAIEEGIRVGMRKGADEIGKNLVQDLKRSVAPISKTVEESIDYILPEEFDRVQIWIQMIKLGIILDRGRKAGRRGGARPPTYWMTNVINSWYERDLFTTYLIEEMLREINRRLEIYR